MRTLLSWSTALSLFCSLALTQFAVDGSKASLQLASVGNAQGVQRELVALVSATGSSTPLPPAPVTAAGKAVVDNLRTAPERLDPAVAWVVAQGHPAHIAAQIASALGIAVNEDLPVMGKGYKSDDGVIHAFGVSTVTANTEIIIYRKIGNSAVDWRVARDGTIITTVTVDQDIQVVPNSQYADLFAGELAYWEAKVPPASPAAAATN